MLKKARKPMSDGFGQHYERMYKGSMVGSGACVFAVWGYVIANTNYKTSCVELNETILATIIGEKASTISAAIEKLCAPDPHSRTKTEGGRRLIKRGEFEYLVVNFRHYRGLISKTRKGEYMAEYMAKRRAEEKANKANKELTTPNSSVFCTLPSASVPEEWGEDMPKAIISGGATLALEAHEAFGDPPNYPDQIVLGNVCELLLMGRTEEQIMATFNWCRMSRSDFKPKSPQALTDPKRWEQWQTMMKDELKEKTKLGLKKHVI
jgi:hypothetical protein